MPIPGQHEQIVGSTGDLILQIARVLVDKPDGVAIEVVITGTEVCMTLMIAPNDRMNVVGEHGIILVAIRAILATINSKAGYHFLLKVEEGVA